MITRRRLLASAAAVTPALALARGPFSNAGPSDRPNPALDLRAVWWFYPSFLEHPEGPWGSAKDRSASPLQAWKDCLSWLAEQGMNGAFIQFGPFGGDLTPSAGDRVRTGWGFHYLLDFQRFPEARTFDRATLARNRELLNAICEHGKAVGCRVYTHHYNFSATKPFVDAHRKDLLEVRVGTKREVKTLYPGFCDRRQILHRNLCWNSPLYREFMDSCWRETFERIPDLAGILVTPGENARCPCVACVGATDDDNAPFQTSPQRLATLGSFVTQFAKTVRECGREPMVRAWAAGKSRPWIEVFPKGVKYFLKYSFFDVADISIDPAVREWVNAGHDVVVTPEVKGGENGGPILWRNSGYFERVVAEVAASGAKGIVGCVNSEHGYLAEPYRVQHAPIESFVHACATNGKSDEGSEAVARRCDREVFGEYGDAVYAALELSSQIVFQLPRVLFEPEEGFTWQFCYHFFAEGWPGRIGGTIDAEPWVARELANLSTLLRAAGTVPFAEPYPESALNGKRDPIAHIVSVTQGAERAQRQLLELAPKIRAAFPGDVQRERQLALVLKSARFATLLGEEWSALLEARLSFEAAKAAVNPPALRAELAQRCLTAFDRCLAAIDATIAEANSFEPGLVGEGLVQRVPRKRAQRLEERALAEQRLATN